VEGGVSGRVLILLVAALSSSGATALAQTTQFDVPSAVQARPDGISDRIRQGEDALRIDDGSDEEHAHAAPPPDPPAKDLPAKDLPAKDLDVTVGMGGGSVERAPRDIREPFDE
jgi:hypothetical protein